jgi:MraZ protein
MGSFFFSGSATAKLDDKSRFVIPQAMRFGLVEDGKLEFAVGLGLGGCLAIYKNSDIKKIVEKFQQKQFVAKFQKFFTLFFSTLHFATCDKLGRVSIPKHLAEVIDIKKDIVVAGVLNKVEIWPKEVYDANMRNLLNPDSSESGDLQEITEEAFGLLNEDDSSEDNDTPAN